MTDGGYTSGEPGVTYREGESLCCTRETNITLCTNYIQVKTFFKKECLCSGWRRKKEEEGLLLTVLAPGEPREMKPRPMNLRMDKS